MSQRDASPRKGEVDKYFLDPAQIRLLRGLKQSATMIRLGELADVDVGIVTGRNSFFTFTDAKAQALGRTAFPGLSQRPTQRADL